MTNCCEPRNKDNKKEGFWQGIIYGLAPHTFCILFVIFSILGTTAGLAFLKPFLLKPYFFHFLLALSFIFATISAIISKRKQLSYFLILYGATILINLMLFFVIFPATANFNLKSVKLAASNFLAAKTEKTAGESFTLQVAIPCSGHASLITWELKKLDGVNDVRFRAPNFFDVRYDINKISKEKITDFAKNIL